MNAKSKKMTNVFTDKDTKDEIVENANANIVQMTEEFRKSLPPMPQSVIDNSILAEEFKAKHPYPYDKI